MTQLATQPDALSAATDAHLLAELASGLKQTADGLRRLAVVFAELERRGHDLGEFRAGVGRVLPLIASGRLAAEAVVAFAGRPAVWRTLLQLPLAEQQALAAGREVEIIDPSDPDRTVRVPLSRVPAAALAVVVGEGRIRSAAEQRESLRPRQARADEPAPERRYRPVFDRNAGVVVVGKMRVRLADLLACLASDRPDKPPPSVDGTPADEFAKMGGVVARCRLWPAEEARLLEAAGGAGLPPSEMIRKAILAFLGV